jgi:hypothetical protein
MNSLHQIRQKLNASNAISLYQSQPLSKQLWLKLPHFLLLLFWISDLQKKKFPSAWTGGVDWQYTALHPLLPACCRPGNGFELASHGDLILRTCLKQMGS